MFTVCKTVVKPHPELEHTEVSGRVIVIGLELTLLIRVVDRDVCAVETTPILTLLTPLDTANTIKSLATPATASRSVSGVDTAIDLFTTALMELMILNVWKLDTTSNCWGFNWLRTNEL